MSSLFVVCGDRGKSCAFYEALGFRVKEPKTRSFVLEAGHGVELHLHDRLTEQEVSIYGVDWARGSRGLVSSFEVSCLDALIQRVPPGSLVRGPVATPWGTRLAMVSDPDGHLLEFREGTKQG